LYQNKYDEAMKKIESLKQGISSDGTTFSNQTMLDDVYWLEANLRMKRGEFEQAILLLGKILEEYQDDVLADDAYFLQAEIYERQLNNKEKAKELYREFLNKYPGSVFAAEARKRFRTLRGDFAGQEQPQF
jgi:outer membrane protein assembly factor BamD (BamD/ComL family)